MRFDEDEELEEEIIREFRRPRREFNINRRGGVEVRLGKHEKSIKKYAEYALYRLRAGSFKTMKHLAFNLGRRPERWARLLRDYAIQEGMITREEWQGNLRKRGRPRKGKPRGPYKKRGLVPS